MMNSTFLFVILLMFIVPQLILLLLVYNAERGYTKQLSLPFSSSTHSRVIQEFEMAKVNADISDINQQIRTMKMAMTELMRARREELEAITKNPSTNLRQSIQRPRLEPKSEPRTVHVPEPVANEILDPLNPPNRPITKDELNRIPLKPTPWSIHPEQAKGKLCLRKWDASSQALAFIHIGKAAGTTMDKMLAGATIHGRKCTKLQTRAVRSVNNLVNTLQSLSTSSCPVCLFCGSHNDFHFLGQAEELKGRIFLTSHVAPVAWIREPAKREVSQFYFSQMKTRVVDQGLKFSDWIWKMALHPETIRGTNSLFADGSSGVMWFSGTVADNWVNVGMPNAQMLWEEKRKRLLNTPTAVLREAVENFNKFLWVGIVESWDEGVELLEKQGGMDLHWSHRSKDNRNPNAGATEAELDLLRMAYPMDAAFYEYAKEMHRKRWELYHTAVNSGRLDDVWCKTPEEAMSYKIPFYFNGERIV